MIKRWRLPFEVTREGCCSVDDTDFVPDLKYAWSFPLHYHFPSVQRSL